MAARRPPSFVVATSNVAARLRRAPSLTDPRGTEITPIVWDAAIGSRPQRGPRPPVTRMGRVRPDRSARTLPYNLTRWNVAMPQGPIGV